MDHISIIGTAGRNGEPLSKEVMMTQLEYLNKVIDQKIENGEEFELVSGGSAWTDESEWRGGDHLAVLLHINKNIPLTLYLPCSFKDGKFDSSQEGKRLNQLHGQYFKVTGDDSLKELDLAIKSPTCNVKVINGFKQRNTFIAQSDIIYAFAYQFKTGGTVDTIKKSKGQVIKIQL